MTPQQPKESKCIECGNPADVNKEHQSEEHPLCAVCISKGWTSDPTEIFNAIQQDPDLKGKIGLSINPEQLL